jgi:hypothetical protein
MRMQLQQELQELTNSFLCLTSAYISVSLSVIVSVCHSVSLFEIEFCYVAQTGLGLEILLPQPSKSWNSKCMPPSLPYNFLFWVNKYL